MSSDNNNILPAQTKNEKTFPTIIDRLRENDIGKEAWLRQCRSFAKWLESERAYYAAALPWITRILWTAYHSVRTFRNLPAVIPGQPFQQLDLSQFRHLAPIQAYITLVQTVIPHYHRFHPSDQARLNILVASIGAQQNPTSIPFTWQGVPPANHGVNGHTGNQLPPNTVLPSQNHSHGPSNTSIAANVAPPNQSHSFGPLNVVTTSNVIPPNQSHPHSPLNATATSNVLVPSQNHPHSPLNAVGTAGIITPNQNRPRGPLNTVAAPNAIGSNQNHPSGHLNMVPPSNTMIATQPHSPSSLNAATLFNVLTATQNHPHISSNTAGPSNVVTPTPPPARSLKRKRTKYNLDAFRELDHQARMERQLTKTAPQLTNEVIDLTSSPSSENVQVDAEQQPAQTTVESASASTETAQPIEHSPRHQREESVVQSTPNVSPPELDTHRGTTGVNLTDADLALSTPDAEPKDTSEISTSNIELHQKNDEIIEQSKPGDDDATPFKLLSRLLLDNREQEDLSSEAAVPETAQQQPIQLNASNNVVDEANGHVMRSVADIIHHHSVNSQLEMDPPATAPPTSPDVPTPVMNLLEPPVVSIPPLPHILLPPTEGFGPELRVVVKSLGAKGKVFFKIEVNTEQFEYISRWNERTKRFVPNLERSLCMSLMCYPAKACLNIEPAGPGLVQLCNTLKPLWPENVDLVLEATLEGTMMEIPLSPPDVLEPEGFVDIGSLLSHGGNELTLSCSTNLQHLIFVVVVHYPTRAQLASYTAVQEQRREWRSWLFSFAQPPDLTDLPGPPHT